VLRHEISPVSTWSVYEYIQYGKARISYLFGVRRLEKQPGITYTEISRQDEPELECLRLKLNLEKITDFPRETFKA